MLDIIQFGQARDQVIDPEHDIGGESWAQRWTSSCSSMSGKRRTEMTKDPPSSEPVLMAFRMLMAPSIALRRAGWAPVPAHWDFGGRECRFPPSRCRPSPRWRSRLRPRPRLTKSTSGLFLEAFTLVEGLTGIWVAWQSPGRRGVPPGAWGHCGGIPEIRVVFARLFSLMFCGWGLVAATVGRRAKLGKPGSCSASAPRWQGGGAGAGGQTVGLST